MSSQRIVFMGTPEFAVPSLEALLDAGCVVVATVTRPDRPSGRGRRIAHSPIKDFSIGRGLRVLQPENIRSEGFLRDMEGLNPDLIVVVAFGKILPLELIKIPRLGCVNVHGSLLPHYRGAAPINWAIINGDNETGVTTMLMDEGMDTGPVLLTERVAIGDDDSSEDLSRVLSLAGATLLVRTVALLAGPGMELATQDEREATYAPLLTKQDGRIDWSTSAEEVRNRVRGTQPWPGAYSYSDGRLIKIQSGRAEGSGGTARPGAVVGTSQESIRVQCGSGVFEITRLQPENKRVMSATEFLKGHRIGDRFR